jgi:hypothetical protein
MVFAIAHQRTFLDEIPGAFNTANYFKRGITRQVMSLWTVPETWTSMGALVTTAACLAAPVFSTLLLLYVTYDERRRERSTSPPCRSKGAPRP